MRLERGRESIGKYGLKRGKIKGIIKGFTLMLFLPISVKMNDIFVREIRVPGVEITM